MLLSKNDSTKQAFGLCMVPTAKIHKSPIYSGLSRTKLEHIPIEVPSVQKMSFCCKVHVLEMTHIKGHMNIKDILSDNTRTLPPIFTSEYYSSIYKKTEKIVCAVFLITDIEKGSRDIEDICRDTRSVSKSALFEIIELISTEHPASFGEIAQKTRTLMSLRSLLYVLVSIHVVRAELVEVLVREIDMVMQNIFAFSRERSQRSGATETEPPYASHDKVQKVVRSTTYRAPTAVSTASEQRRLHVPGGRRQQILGIIRTKGVVSIKDISDSVTDCSEKTIQRELIDMIKDNLITKVGERRWSKYSLLNG